MENKRLAWLQAHIGKSTKNSPSPFAHWLDGVLEQAELGEVAVRFAVRPDMTNPFGMLHGGVISGMLDDVSPSNHTITNVSATEDTIA